MVKQLGRTMLVLVTDGSGGFNALGGLTQKSLTINNERIDATTPDLTTPEGIQWACSLAGTKQIMVSGDMKLIDIAAEARITTAAMSASATDTFQIVIPSIGTFQGLFSVAVEFSGEGSLDCSVTLESVDAVSFTAAA